MNLYIFNKNITYPQTRVAYSLKIFLNLHWHIIIYKITYPSTTVEFIKKMTYFELFALDYEY